MKVAAALVLFAAFALPSAHASSTDPIEKVLQMISDLEAKIITEGKDGQKVYDEFSEFCEDRSRELGFEIKSGKSTKKDLDATIADEKAKQESLNAKIEELAAAIATDEADLKAATDIREKEHKAFLAEEKELVDVIDTLSRAIGILEKELNKGGASMMQLQSAQSVAQALAVMVEEISLKSADTSKLTALLQNSQESEDSSDAMGAPAAKVYKNKSGGIIETMQDLYEKAEAQLEEVRGTEKKNLQAYQMLAQSLKDEIKFGTKDMNKAKKSADTSAEAQASAEGDLAVTTKDLDEDVKALATLHQDCMTGAEDFEAETRSRGEELKALATAKKVLQEALGGAAEQTYSFIQVVSRSSLSTGVDLANFEAVRFIRDLARKEKSTELAQLASRMASAVRFASAGGADPFAKVKSLITGMLERLEKDAQGDASHKAYCDKETSEATAKKTEKKALIDKLTTQIDSANARSAQLKEEVAALQNQLAQLASSQAEMNKIRADEKSLYNTNSAEMKQGIDGVQKALSVLKEYYASEGKSHSSADGAGSGIIGMLEVVESDFSKGLAEMETTESMAASSYDKVSKENDITRAMKTQDVKYKSKEAASQAKAASETSSDRGGAQAELDAIMEYLGKLEKMCVAKAEPYAEKVARRESELAGLKEALSILEGEAVLIQQTSKRTLRGRH